MAHKTCLALVILALAACQATAPPTQEPAPETEETAAPRAVSPPPETLVEGNTRFALGLYKKLAENPGNVAFSPISISLALAMAQAGAQGETESELRAVLSLPNGDPHGEFAALRETLTPDEDDSYELAVANRLWAASDLELQPSYVELTRDQYGAPVERVDFAASDPTTALINDWVEAQTQGRIQDLIPAGLLSEATRLVLTNAVYFKGTWKRKFPEGNTQEADFFAVDGIDKVPMMRNFAAGFKLADVDDLEILEMAYAGDDLSMLILLPDTPDGLPGLEAKLTEENLTRWLLELRKAQVDVQLPRFKAESSFDLGQVLQALGMQQAFVEGAANFGGIHVDPNEKLWISAVIHKAFVEVNEEGSEAAAATAVIMSKGRSAGAPRPPRKFIADHPFLYIIRDNRTESLLFMGRVESF